MSEERVDPSGNTQAFRAFVQAGEEIQSEERSRTPLIAAGIAVVALIALVVVLALLLTR
jgi:hypothetical protein